MNSRSSRLRSGARVSADHLKSTMCRALIKAGTHGDDAQIVAGILVEADLRGIDSHGIAKLPTYLRRIAAGTIQPSVRGPAVEDHGAVAHYDGLRGLGPLIAYRAMEHTILRAGEFGVAAGFVRHSNHVGMAGYYAEMAARGGGIGVFTTNAGASMAPWAGRVARLGTNPIAIAIPHAPNPILLDMATSTVAKGKIELVLAAGHDRIPAGWGLDTEGKPTRSGSAAQSGTLTPLGGYKGSGLAFVVSALSAVAAAGVDSRQPSLSGQPEVEQDIGHFMLAISAGALPGGAEARLRELAETIRRDPPAEGFDSIRLPGDPEWATRADHAANGVVLCPATAKALSQLETFIGTNASAV